MSPFRSLCRFHFQPKKKQFSSASRIRVRFTGSQAVAVWLVARICAGPLPKLNSSSLIHLYLFPIFHENPHVGFFIYSANNQREGTSSNLWRRQPVSHPVITDIPSERQIKWSHVDSASCERLLNISRHVYLSSNRLLNHGHLSVWRHLVSASAVGVIMQSNDFIPASPV